MNFRDEIDTITKQFLDAFENLSAEQLNFKPNPNTWSIAQNIHHLIVINLSYFPVVESVKNNIYSLPFIAKFNFLVNFFGNLVHSSVLPTRRRKIKTFPIWEPSVSTIDTTILAQFIQHQDQLKQLINQSGELISKNTVICSPANKNIVYKLEKAFEIIITHENRHLEQAKELLIYF